MATSGRTALILSALILAALIWTARRVAAGRVAARFLAGPVRIARFLASFVQACYCSIARSWIACLGIVHCYASRYQGTHLRDAHLR